MSHPIRKIKWWLPGGVLALIAFMAGEWVGENHGAPGRGKMVDNMACYELRLLWFELKEYSQTHDGRLPASLAELNAGFLRDPFSGSDFNYVGNGLKWNALAWDTLLAYTGNTRGDGHQYALFGGGGAMRTNMAELKAKLGLERAKNQHSGIDLLTASEVTIGHKADGTPIKVQVTH